MACGYAKIDSAEPMMMDMYPISPARPPRVTPSTGDGVREYQFEAASNVAPQPPDIATISTADTTTQMSSTSLAIESSAGARRPDRKVLIEIMAIEMTRGQSPRTPR